LRQKIHIRTGKRVTKGTQEGCEGIVQRTVPTDLYLDTSAEGGGTGSQH
jgi:hypothetical protein